jgi:hypothetical protein
MLKSHELFGFMSPALANEILAYTFTEEKPAYRAILQAVAQARHLRPVFLERQARSQRDTTILATLTRPQLDVAAGTLLRTWLVKKHSAMLVDFLDALGIPNEKGVVEELPANVDDAKLKAAVEGLLAKHPPEAVAVYLNAFNDMNEANWPSLNALLETESRLQLGGG